MPTLREGIRRTQVRVTHEKTRGGGVLPDHIIKVEAGVNTKRGRQAAAEIQEAFNTTDPGARTVVDFLRTERMTRLLVTDQDPRAQSAMVNGVQDASDIGFVRNFFDSALVEVVEGDVLFSLNPKFWAGLNSKERKIAIEHELWHIYLHRAFPSLTTQFNTLRLTAKIFFPYMAVNLAQPLAHMYLRQTARLAGRERFVIEDVRLVFRRFLSGEPLAEAACGAAQRDSAWMGFLLETDAALQGISLSSCRNRRALETELRTFIARQGDEERQRYQRAIATTRRVVAAVGDTFSGRLKTTRFADPVFNEAIVLAEEQDREHFFRTRQRLEV
ncbi:MAG: hypothetical protein WC901_01565 [Candidatus Margulisiibacteriota bacterium]